MAKVDALAPRIADIHPGCAVTAVEEFVDATNWPALCPARRCRHRRLRRRSRQGRARRLGAARPERRSSSSARPAASAPPSASRSATSPTSRTTRCSALRQRLRKSARDAALGRARCLLRVLARAGRRAGRRRVRRRRQPQLPRLRLQRRRDGDLRHGRGGDAPLLRGDGGRPPETLTASHDNRRLGNRLLAQLVEQRTFNP